MSKTYFLSTPFGDFDIFIEDESKGEEEAVEELRSEIEAANCREAYLNADGKIYSIDIGFYYGSSVIELDELFDDENEATVHASNILIEQLNNEF